MKTTFSSTITPMMQTVATKYGVTFVSLTGNEADKRPHFEVVSPSGRSARLFGFTDPTFVDDVEEPTSRILSLWEEMQEVAYRTFGNWTEVKLCSRAGK